MFINHGNINININITDGRTQSATAHDGKQETAQQLRGLSQDQIQRLNKMSKEELSQLICSNFLMQRDGSLFQSADHQGHGQSYFSGPYLPGFGPINQINDSFAQPAAGPHHKEAAFGNLGVAPGQPSPEPLNKRPGLSQHYMPKDNAAQQQTYVNNDSQSPAKHASWKNQWAFASSQEADGSSKKANSMIGDLSPERMAFLNQASAIGVHADQEDREPSGSGGDYGNFAGQPAMSHNSKPGIRIGSGPSGGQNQGQLGPQGTASPDSPSSKYERPAHVGHVDRQRANFMAGVLAQTTKNGVSNGRAQASAAIKGSASPQLKQNIGLASTGPGPGAIIHAAGSQQANLLGFAN